MLYTGSAFLVEREVYFSLPFAKLGGYLSTALAVVHSQFVVMPGINSEPGQEYMSQATGCCVQPLAV